MQDLCCLVRQDVHGTHSGAHRLPSYNCFSSIERPRDRAAPPLAAPPGAHLRCAHSSAFCARRVPLEIKAQKDKAPTYEINLEDLGRPNDQPSLPFNAFGTLAWARAEFDNNSASSQVFWLLKESELTPSGANLLDGRYAVFGYIVDVRPA